VGGQEYPNTLPYTPILRSATPGFTPIGDYLPKWDDPIAPLTLGEFYINHSFVMVEELAAARELQNYETNA